MARPMPFERASTGIGPGRVVAFGGQRIHATGKPVMASRTPVLFAPGHGDH
jgi:hypothetical protein